MHQIKMKKKITITILILGLLLGVVGADIITSSFIIPKKNEAWDVSLPSDVKTRLDNAGVTNKKWLGDFEFIDDKVGQMTYCYTINGNETCNRKTLFMDYYKESRYCIKYGNGEQRTGIDEKGIVVIYYEQVCTEWGNIPMAEFIKIKSNEIAVKVLTDLDNSIRSKGKEVYDIGTKTTNTGVSP